MKRYFYRMGGHVFVREGESRFVTVGGVAFPVGAFGLHWIRTDAFKVVGSYPDAIQAS